MRRFALAALCVWAASAQTLVPPAEVSKVAGIFERGPGEKSRYCTVQLEQPRLNYSFRFRFGYNLQLPVRNTQTRGLTGRLVFRVTPEGGDASAYFADQFQLASALGKVDEVQNVSGEFFLGEGRYQVQFAFSDGAGGVCRRHWRVEARLKPNERSVKLTLPPGAAADRAAARIAPRPASPPTARRITVLMNSDGLTKAAATLVEPLLEAFPGAEIRLSAFITHGQMILPAGVIPPEARELVRLSGVKPEDLDDIARAIDARKSGAYRQGLLTQTDCWELFADLLRREDKAQSPPDLIVFVGPRNTAWYPMPPHFLEAESGAGRRVFYLKFTGCTEHLYVPEYNWRAFGSYHSFANAPCPLNSPYAPPRIDLPDAIESTVARVKGQTLPFYSPAGLAKAIDSIRQAGGR